MEYEPVDKAEFVEMFAPKNKRALLHSKLIRPNGEFYYQIYTNAGLFEIRYDKHMRKDKRYIMTLNNSHLGYYPSIIQASIILTTMTYDEVFR